MKDWSVRKLLLRQLALFSIIISLPFVTLSWLIDHYYLRYIEDTAAAQNGSVFRKAVSVFENEIDQLHKAALQFNSNYEFSEEKLRASFPLFYPVANAISAIKNTNNFVDDIVFYNYGMGDTVWTTQGTFNGHYYGEYINGRLEGRSSSVNFYLNQGYYLYKQQILYSSEWLAGTLDYVVNLPKVDGVVSFRIGKRSLDKLFSQPLESSASQVYIYDRKGEMVYSLDGNPMDESLLEALWNEPESSYTQKWGELVAFKEISPQTGLVYLSILPKSVVVRPVARFQTIFRLVTILLFMAGGALVCLFTILNFRPIKRLYDFALTKVDRKALPPEMDVLQRVQQAIATLDDAAKMRAQEQIQTRRERLLLELFRGSYQAPEEFNQTGLELGLVLTGTVYRVITVRYEADETELDNCDTMFAGLEGLLSIHHDAYGLHYRGRGQYVLLLAYPEGENCVERAVELISSALLAGSCRTSFVGIGEECRALNDVFRSYLQSGHAAEHGKYSQKSVVYYGSLDGQDGLQYHYPRAELDNLFNAILSRDAVQVDFILSTLSNMIESYYQSMFLIVCFCGDIFSTVLKACGQLDQDYGSKCFGTLKSIDVTRLQSVSEIVRSLELVKEELLALLEQYNLQSGTIEIAAVESYIKENSTCYDLTASSVADHFSVTPSNLSHQFKAQMGYNISDYINKEKMNYAKRLLAFTGLTISEIAEKAGYSQPSSFIRKFKQYEELTPGEYKRRLQESGEEK